MYPRLIIDQKLAANFSSFGDGSNAVNTFHCTYLCKWYYVSSSSTSSLKSCQEVFKCKHQRLFQFYSIYLGKEDKKQMYRLTVNHHIVAKADFTLLAGNRLMKNYEP